MRRRLPCLILSALLALAVLSGCGEAGPAEAPSPSAAAAPSPTPTPFTEPLTEPGGPVWFDGKELPDGRFRRDGTDYVLLSQAAEALDTEIKISDGGKTFTMPWRRSEVSLSPDRDTALYLDTERPLEAPPLLCRNGEDLLVPVRSFCEAAEIGVYDDEELGELTCTPGTGDWELKPNFNVCVMMYHGIGSAQPEANLILSPHSLEEQFRYLNEHGFTSIWFEDLWHVEDIEKPIILIFDDGWSGCYRYLYPLCEEYHIKATVALITGHIDRYGSKLTSEQLEEMRESPWLSFYSHTVTHDTLSEIPDDRIEPELRDSEQWIVRFFHREPVTLVYPTGGSTPLVQELTRRYYRFGVKMTHPDVIHQKAWTSYNTSDDPTLVYRYFVQRQTSLQHYAMWIEYPFSPKGTADPREEPLPQSWFSG